MPELVEIRVGGRKRTLLARIFGWEIVLISFSPRTCSHKHDHDSPGFVKELGPGRVFQISEEEPATFFGEDDGLLPVVVGPPHIVGNIGTEPAYSLHCYKIGNKPMLGMKRYPITEANREALAKIGGVFAE